MNNSIFCSEITKNQRKAIFSAQGSQNAPKDAISERQQINKFCEKNINLQAKSFTINP